MRSLFTASTAIALVLAAPLSAETASTESFTYTPSGEEIMASGFIGARVYVAEEDVAEEATWLDWDGTAQEWDDIGEIHDVLMNRDGELEAILVDVGGFLGIGEKQVSVTMDKLKLVSDGPDAEDYFVVFTASQDSIEAAPIYEVKSDAANLEEAAEAGAQEMEETGEAVFAQAEETGEATLEEGEAALEETGDAVGSAMEETGDAVGSAMEQTGDAVGSAMEETGDAIGSAADATGEKVEAAVAGTAAGAAAQHEGYAAADHSMISAEALTGARVYDANGDWIGEVHEVLTGADGSATDAVIDVGGFLGIGEKPVKMGLSELEVIKEIEGDDLRVLVDTTKDLLMEAPEYEG